MTLLDGWKLSLNVDAILRGQATDPQVVRSGKPQLLAAAEKALTDGISLLHPRTLFQEFIVNEHRHERIKLEGGQILTGPLVSQHLSGAQRIVPVVCTIGSELEKAVSKLFDEDPLYALALDGLGNASVERLAQQVCALIGEETTAKGLNASSPLSPGAKDWPVEVGQPQLFNLLDPVQLGITLTSGGMMVPKKSTSFVIGIGSAMSQANLCDICSLKETCRYQHA